MDGVELGAWDRRVADWLAGLDTSAALTIAAWIQHSPAGARRRLAREQRHSPGQR
jgi:hypothetical protein